MKVMVVFDAVILLFGIYMVVSSLQMKKSGRINAMVIAEEEMKKCKDTAGFIAFIYWREAREFDTLKSKKVPQSLETGLFFCQIFILVYSNIW